MLIVITVWTILWPHAIRLSAATGEEQASKDEEQASEGQSNSNHYYFAHNAQFLPREGNQED
jgi:hypothetical protein